MARKQNSVPPVGRKPAAESQAGSRQSLELTLGMCTWNTMGLWLLWSCLARWLAVALDSPATSCTEKLAACLGSGYLSLL